jgi:hypothetical protein
MLLRGFSEEFLNSENLVFMALRKYSGVSTAVCFLSLMILNEGIVDNRIHEAQQSVPLWVQQKIGFQNNEDVTLASLSLQLGFFTGLSTLAGIIYILIRHRPVIDKLLTAKLQNRV